MAGAGSDGTTPATPQGEPAPGATSAQGLVVALNSLLENVFSKLFKAPEVFRPESRNEELNKWADLGDFNLNFSVVQLMTGCWH